ncbi:MAG TPA: recombination mediator RecR [Bacteroidales bacterium]|nr:recombination mediator RecR [Bacteroidales bacterium]
MYDIPSRLVETAIQEISRLPGIGRKTALRLVLHLLRKDTGEALALGQAIIQMREQIVFCRECHNISDHELCQICANPSRDERLICVVADVRDMLAIENTQLFKGKYHILGGVISPIEGISPDQLHIHSLVKRTHATPVDEILLALPSTVEGDTTNFYIYNQLKDSNIRLTILARGIAVGDGLEYTDEVTLGRSILQRLPFTASLGRT